MVDHVHMMLSVPPKYAVSQVVGYMKGKSAIHLARVYGERKRNFVGQSFWARGSRCCSPICTTCCRKACSARHCIICMSPNIVGAYRASCANHS